MKKNSANIKNHDIDFSDAWRIFERPMVIKADTRRNYGEERWIALRRLLETAVTIVYTYRSKKIRIISIRRANRNERKTYEARCQKQNQLGETATSQ